MTVAADSGPMLGFSRSAKIGFWIDAETVHYHYMRPTNKKPRLVAEAKCLIILVGRDRFELSTYGLRVFRSRTETHSSEF